MVGLDQQGLTIFKQRANKCLRDNSAESTFQTQCLSHLLISEAVVSNPYLHITWLVIGLYACSETDHCFDRKMD